MVRLSFREMACWYASRLTSSKLQHTRHIPRTPSRRAPTRSNNPHLPINAPSTPSAPPPHRAHHHRRHNHGSRLLRRSLPNPRSPRRRLRLRLRLHSPPQQPRRLDPLQWTRAIPLHPPNRPAHLHGAEALERAARARSQAHRLLHRCACVRHRALLIRVDDPTHNISVGDLAVREHGAADPGGLCGCRVRVRA